MRSPGVSDRRVLELVWCASRDGGAERCGSGRPDEPGSREARCRRSRDGAAGGDRRTPRGGDVVPDVCVVRRDPASIRGLRGVQGPLADCSGLYTTSFVPGFNGFAASGEVAGTAPACSRRATRTGAPGADVVVNAWFGRRLAGSTAVDAGPRSSQPYRLIVAPGRYRITATRALSREVIVRVGRIDDLGRYGGCASPGTITSTIPGAGGGATTSTTARAATTSASVAPAVTCGQTLATISSANQCTGPRRAASALSSGVPGAMSANIQGAHTKSVTPASAKRR